MRVPTLLFVSALAILAACGRQRLDTRTFQLKNLNGEEAARLLGPYVFTDRKDAPGAMSYVESSITVRETPDNLDKIARVLSQFDRSKPSVQLHFQIIEADGATTRDPAIADVESALRKLFRFKGYRLIAEAAAGGIEGSRVRQLVSAGGAGGPYMIDAHILEVRGSGDSASVRLETEFSAPHLGPVLTTTVTLASGQAGVLGNAQMDLSKGTLILVVRPEITKN
jgi:hypothetical protein